MQYRTVRSLAAASALCVCAGCGYDITQAEHPTASARPAARTTIAQAHLLKEQPEPDCEYRAGKGDVAPTRAPEPESAREEARIKLDYERQCYKHAEMIARERLTKLQAAMRHTAQRSVRAEVRSLPAAN